MSLPFNVREVLAVSLLLLAAAVSPAVAQGNYAASAGEYSAAGSLVGDQVQPQVAIKPTGGYIVWQDNITDTDGLGISTRKLDNTLSPTLANLRVNQLATGDQENPQVALLNNGSAAFTWQGGKQGFQRIYTRVLASGGTWQGGDILVNSFTNDYQVTPVIAALTNGTYAVAWGSFNQAASDSMQDVYFQIFNPNGTKIGGELLANQVVAYNQRTPSVAGLSDGRLVVVWVTEQQTGDNALDIYGRIFNSNGAAAGNEFRITTGTNITANPSVTATANGGFAVAWSERDLASLRTNSWDVYVRTFNAAANGSSVSRVNTYTYGDQFAPKISFDGTDLFVVWTSLGQDGSRDGLFGQFLHVDGSPDGGELQVNSTTASQQIQPAVAADGAGKFLAVWTSFGGGANSFDLFAQRYASTLSPLVAPSAPLVSALDSYRLQVAWPALAGYSVAGYEVYADGASTATVTVTNNYWWMTGLLPQSAHNFRLAYVLADGRRSPLSASASGTTWGYDNNYDGLPDDWETLYFGNNSANWPALNADSDGDGMNNLREFLAGTNPTNAASVLRVKLENSNQGLFLSWNTQPGLMYQLQSSTVLGVWSNFGAPRMAAGTNDSTYVGGSGQTFYQVLRLR
ncbi:MAG: hypothetical protein RL380_1745 [Verrucomicrobiota bacterium]